MSINSIQSNRNVNHGKQQISFGKKFPTKDVLQIVAGRSLEIHGATKSAEIAKVLFGDTKANVFTVRAKFKELRTAVIEQHKELKEVAKSAKSFFRISDTTPQHLKIWVRTQLKKIGKKELDLQPIKK